MYAKMLTAVMAATGLGVGYVYTSAELADASSRLESFYEVEVEGSRAELDAIYADVLDGLGFGR